MARKSRDTIWRERLSAVSACPDDLFDLFPPDDALLDLISHAERGESHATASILAAIYKLVSSPELMEEARIHRSYAILYWLDKAAAINDGELARTVISTVLTVGYGFEAADAALSHMEGSPLRDGMRAELSVLRVIDDAAEGAGYLSVLPNLLNLDQIVYADVWAYALSMTRGDGTANRLSVDICSSLGLSILTTLPSFGKATPVYQRPSDGEISRLLATMEKISGKYFHLAWRDFWLRCMFEVTEEYRSSEHTEIARFAASVVGNRYFSRNKNLHALAWVRYLYDRTSPDSPDAKSLHASLNELEALCRFDYTLKGDLTQGDVVRLIREAVYTSSTEEKRRYEREARLGNVFVHERNRYHLDASLAGHSKRGRRHYWETTVSLPLDGEEATLPEIDELRIERALNTVTRGGVTLPHDKGTSQVILTSEISVHGIRHPLTVDLILDIAYISSVKCGYGEIRVTDHDVIDGYLVMSCQLFLY